ncbi:MAG TPA: MATE family efflux transporter [Candidatus Limivivens intestinipullorum]|uniref:Probable multidrug resistance protein NorM n=1 Tax=Candidatus Limivivens intestinipullorum TaxID=2840858 RepID=A0A9D1JK88_9FIRM|nr:MATE family efflux transporter [Candidatus Limivivens intestinipullorum]
MEQQHLFSNRDLRKLLVPIIVEQLLNSLMGTADTVMVSNVGPEAISAVSLVDSINVLIIQAFSALAAGGTILCSHYMGTKDRKGANHCAGQVTMVITCIAVVMTVLGLCFKTPLLRGIFGAVEPAVMEASQTYFFYTLLSFPFIALYDAGSSIFRAQENTRTPMVISILSNLMNIGGNALLIWGFHMGVAGAAIATLVSRIFCAAAVMWKLKNPKLLISVRDYRKLRPDFSVIRRVLALGIPSGIENGMFQFGKLAIQSTVSSMGTTAIAAQAMTNIMESVNGVGGIGVGIGLMTIVGECMGAGRKDEAAYYIKKLTVIGEAVIIASCLAVYAIARPVTVLGGMEAESARLCVQLVGLITIVKPLVWALSFIPAYGLRAAGDVKFSMITSCVTMWMFRVTLCVFLVRAFGLGPIAVWIGMFADWTIRGIVFTLRFLSGKWSRHKVLSE